jgi:integrase
MVNTLRNAFRLAREEWGWMTNNPITGFRIPKHAPPRDKIMSWREIRGMCRALGYLPGYKPATKQQEVAYALLVALRTGMRAGEVLQINQENVDLDKRVIRIRNHKTRKVTGKDRIVPISTKAARLIKTVGSFTIPSASLDSLFRKARANAGLEGFTFHDSRATALTWLSKQVDAITLARISGHRNLSILLNTYYRESPEDIAKRLA